jgi:hypothetical protein
MTQYPPARGNTAYIQDETSILEDPYQKEVQLDIWQDERKKTRYAHFTIGVILLVSNVMGLSYYR